MNGRVTPLQIRAIHTVKTRAGLDDAAYRELLSDFGVASSKDLSRGGAESLLERMRLLPGARFEKSATGPYAPKLQALWIAAWNLGIVRNRTDAAMHTFVFRQTGVDHTRFLRDHKAAAKAIEALKAWIAREAGVEWPKDTGTADPIALKLAVLDAQCRLLGRTGGFPYLEADRAEDLDSYSAGLGSEIRLHARHKRARAA